MAVGQHPFRQVVDLREVAPVTDAKLPGPPEIFERGLRRMPFPPATLAARLVGADLARADRPAAADMGQHILDLRVELGALPIRPSPLQAVGLAREADLPVGEIFRRQDRRVMGPMLEQGAVAFKQRRQMLRPVALPPRPEDHVMRAFDRVDAVDLHEAEAADEVQEVIAPGRTCRRL